MRPYTLGHGLAILAESMPELRSAAPVPRTDTAVRCSCRQPGHGPRPNACGARTGPTSPSAPCDRRRGGEHVGGRRPMDRHMASRGADGAVRRTVRTAARGATAHRGSRLVLPSPHDGCARRFDGRDGPDGGGCGARVCGARRRRSPTHGASAACRSPRDRPRPVGDADVEHPVVPVPAAGPDRTRPPARGRAGARGDVGDEEASAWNARPSAGGVRGAGRVRGRRRRRRARVERRVDAPLRLPRWHPGSPGGRSCPPRS